MQRIGVEEFLEDGQNGRIIDVRSPAEFHKGHIPGAINIPIFTNKERAEVGTVYKQESREEAILLGLDIVGPKLRQIADEGKIQAVNNTLYVYCWRGGMRSEKMAWLFELNGLHAKVLEGGYKQYRKYGKEIINKIGEYLVIQGPTGSGKTEIIQALDRLGEQTIDLEGLARHKGSTFGGLGEPKQPSTQQFQNEVYALINNFNPKKPVWLESESATIGKVYLPEELWQRMNSATIVAINVPLEERLATIIQQYGQFPQDELITRVHQLQQKLGGAMVKEITTDIKNNNLVEAVRKLLHYYDKSYSYSAKYHKVKAPIKVDLPTIEPLVNAKLIMATYNQVPV